MKVIDFFSVLDSYSCFFEGDVLCIEFRTHNRLLHDKLGDIKPKKVFLESDRVQYYYVVTADEFEKLFDYEK